MARQKSIYRRLTGRYRTVLGYSQLWIAPDHILLLKSSRLAEEYRRFAFSDIQAVVVTEMPDSQVTQFVAILGALLWTSLAATVSTNFSRGFFLITGVWLMVLAVINLARGRRCTCHLYTAVSRELLTPVRRVRTAKEFLARIRPKIEAAQGSLSAEAVAQKQVEGVAEQATERPPEIRPAIGYAMEILFGIILVDAVLIPVSQRFVLLESEMSGLLLTTFMAEIGLAIFVLVRRVRPDPRRIGLMLTGLALAFMAVDVFGLGRSAVAWFGQLMEAARQQQTTPPKFVWALTPMWLYFAFGWRIFTGLAGLATTRIERSGGTG
jgi:hypothetical protein